ncbi:GIY-YIG domain-containing protein [Streptococcus pneumoniae]|nr:GIY-YIG domain-containing protein [Streptococcus pneumoniae]
MDHKAYMYVLECRDGSYYIGYTTDVRRRLAIHNSGKGAKYTRARLPVKLIYAQGFASKEEVKNRGESFDSSYLCQKAKKMLQ